MNDAVRATAATLVATHRLFHRGLDGLDRAQLLAQPAGSENPLLWIACHMTQVRAQFARVFGTTVEFPWPGFKRGEPRTDPAGWPEYADVARLYDEAHAAMMTGLEGVTPEWLAAPKGALPGIGDERYGTLALMALHESYHCGQISQLRRQLGLEGLVG